MKKIVYGIRALCIALALLALPGHALPAAATPANTASPAAAVSSADREGKRLAASPSIQNKAVSTLTEQQRLADYDAMWKDIEDNYPLMGVAERTTGKNFEKIQAAYREQARTAKSDYEFWQVIANCLDEFEMCGHMSVFNANLFTYAHDIYQSIPGGHCEYLYRILNNPTSKAFYGYEPSHLFDQEDAGGSGVNEAQKNLPENARPWIIEPGKIAYLGIPSFGMEYTKADSAEIASFFSEIKDYPYCIIDVRGNGGGDTNYWAGNLVGPNLKNNASITYYELVRGNICKTYQETDGGDPLKPISTLPALPALNSGDVAQMKYYQETTMEIQRTAAEPYAGKIYVLADRRNYSSAEAFVSFCKATGFATVIGEATGGDGIGIDPIIFTLPNSGICFRLSATLGLNPDGASNEEFGTTPDIACSSADALQVCLNKIRNAG